MFNHLQCRSSFDGVGIIFTSLMIKLDLGKTKRENQLGEIKNLDIPHLIPQKNTQEMLFGICNV